MEDERQTDRGRLTVSQGSLSHLSATKTIQVKVKSLDLEVLAIFSCRAIGSLDGEDRSRSWWSIKVVNCHILNKMTGDLLYPGCEVLSAEGVEESDVVDVADPLGQDGVQPVRGGGHKVLLEDGRTQTQPQAGYIRYCGKETNFIEYWGSIWLWELNLVIL